MALRKKSNKEAIERLAMRVPAALKDKCTRAAELRGETFSGWARHVLDEAADRQIREYEFTTMALSDRIAFCEAVLSTPKPTRAAVTAAKRYKKVLALGNDGKGSKKLHVRAVSMQVSYL